MRRNFKADRDAYITDRVVKGTRRVSASTGWAGSLDLFKLYGLTVSGGLPNVELSRILIHFDIEELKELVSERKIDPSDPSFWCKMRLKDVNGGQPVPSDFTISVFPLSASFREGLGKDISYYSDRDVCNWLSSSIGVSWHLSGCASPCHASIPGDYITSSISLASTETQAFFKTGEEDLVVDVTQIVSATLSGEIPDEGFRIAFTGSLEEDSYTYFVKRFASRHAYDESFRPRLDVGFDDSVRDDWVDAYLDVDNTVSLYNEVFGVPSNIVSGSSYSPVTGSNCIVLKLTTNVSGGSGSHTYFFTGSQRNLGTTGFCPVTGAYDVTFNVSSFAPVIVQKLLTSSSIVFSTAWLSQDLSTTYASGSNLTLRPSRRAGAARSPKRHIHVRDVRDAYYTDESVRIRVDVFDYTDPLLRAVKVPIEPVSLVVRDMHYSVRDVRTGETVIEIDTSKNSTRLSSDSSGMFFDFHVGSLMAGRSYALDFVTTDGGTRVPYRDAVPSFRVETRR